MRKENAFRFLIGAVAVLGGLLCIPAFIMGADLVRDWVAIKTSPLMYFQYRYLLSGLLWMGISFVGIGAMLLSFKRQSARMLGALLALVVGSVACITLPDRNPSVAMMSRVTSLLGHADRSLAAWDDSHGRFPSDETELLAALSRPLSEPGFFCAGSREYPYTVKTITNATGPYMGPVPDRPGVLVYAVRDNLHEYWITISTLDAPVNGRVVFHHVAGDYKNGKLWVMNRTHRQDGQRQRGFID